jgi:dTDP-glucose 4,6-dehydratase
MESVSAHMTTPLAGELDWIMDVTRPPWRDLHGARLFITGGTGFFGSWLLETLLWANERRALGATAVVLTRDPAAFARRAPRLATDPAVSLHQGDVTTFAFPAGGATHVIHAAVETTTASAQVSGLREFDSTITGTRRVLDFAKHAAARRLLFVSSGSVYGMQPNDLPRMPETYSGAPDVTAAVSAGAEAKRAAELLCTLYADDRLVTTTARCFSFLGPYLPIDGKFAIGNFLRDALNGGPIRILGDGSPVRSYMYGADLAVWLWTILARGASGRAYNVGSEEAVTIADAAAAVARRFSPVPEVSILGAPPLAARPSGQASSQYVPDTSRARSELGLRVAVDFNDALTRTVAWHTNRDTSAHVSR